VIFVSPLYNILALPKKPPDPFEYCKAPLIPSEGVAVDVALIVMSLPAEVFGSLIVIVMLSWSRQLTQKPKSLIRIQ
jgi:hypothetical protein